jgi:hypothetical protein
MEMSQGHSLCSYLIQIKMSFFPNREQEGKTREGRGGYKEREYVEV